MAYFVMCPHCGRPVMATRLGVTLTPRQAQLFDIVYGAGDTRITTEALMRRLGMSKTNVHVTKKAVNDKLLDAGAGYVIDGEYGEGYRLVMVQPSKL
jgi:biotin operon repressor